MLSALLIAAGFAANCAAISNATDQIEAAIVAKGGPAIQHNLANAPTAIASIPGGGGVLPDGISFRNLDTETTRFMLHVPGPWENPVGKDIEIKFDLSKYEGRSIDVDQYLITAVPGNVTWPYNTVGYQGQQSQNYIDVVYTTESNIIIQGGYWLDTAWQRTAYFKKYSDTQKYIYNIKPTEDNVVTTRLTRVGAEINGTPINFLNFNYYFMKDMLHYFAAYDTVVLCSYNMKNAESVDKLGKSLLSMEGISQPAGLDLYTEEDLYRTNLTVWADYCPAEDETLVPAGRFSTNITATAFSNGVMIVDVSLDGCQIYEGEAGYEGIFAIGAGADTRNGPFYTVDYSASNKTLRVYVQDTGSSFAWMGWSDGQESGPYARCFPIGSTHIKLRFDHDGLWLKDGDLFRDWFPLNEAATQQPKSLTPRTVRATESLYGQESVKIGQTNTDNRDVSGTYVVHPSHATYNFVGFVERIE